MKDKKSLVGVWVEASRPKTLTASASPVLLGCALAYYDGMFDIVPAVLCFLVALFAQIASNFANDYFDFKKGADREDRLGPERAVAQGWIAPKAMLVWYVRYVGGCLFVRFVADLFCRLALDMGGNCDCRVCVGLFCRSLSFWPITVWEIFACCCSMGSYPFVSLIIYRR